MVLVKAKRDELLGPLSAVSGIIERRHTLPILSNVLIECGVGALSFVATDIEIQITSHATLESSGEVRSVTVGARKLVDILRALPDSAEITLQQQDKRLLVRAGKSRFVLQTLPAEDFPRLAKPAGDVARFSLQQKDLRRLLGLVQYSMAQQDIRYYLNGLLMVVEDKALKLIATDGHRLAFASMALEAKLPRQEVIVPRKTVLELAKLLSDSDAEGRIEVSSAEADRRERKYQKNGQIWCFTLSRRWYRDGNVGGSTARFINHSCEGNCYSEVVDDVVWIRASKNIPKGAELSYDYNTKGEADMRCRCRPGCKTLI